MEEIAGSSSGSYAEGSSSGSPVEQERELGVPIERKGAERSSGVIGERWGRGLARKQI